MTIEISGGLPAHLVREIYQGLQVLEHADEVIEQQVELTF